MSDTDFGKTSPFDLGNMAYDITGAPVKQETTATTVEYPTGLSEKKPGPPMNIEATGRPLIPAETKVEQTVVVQVPAGSSVTVEPAASAVNLDELTPFTT